MMHGQKNINLEQYKQQERLFVTKRICFWKHKIHWMFEGERHSTQHESSHPDCTKSRAWL